jgi:hypothetical protein
MQFSMAPRFKLQLLRSIKFSKILRLARHDLVKTKEHRSEAMHYPQDLQSMTLPLRHRYLIY